VQKRLAGRGLKPATLSPRARLMPANKQSAKIRTKVQEADCEPSAELFRLWLL